MTSTLGVLISAVNSQCRLIFNAGREGLLPSWLGKVHPTRRTPVNAIYAFVGDRRRASSCVLGAGAPVRRPRPGSMDPINFFVESSTMGTILVLVVYFLANLALPFYYRKYRPQEFSVVKHVVLPVLGMVAIARAGVLPRASPARIRRTTGSRTRRWPSWWSRRVYALVLNRRDPGLGDRAGSIIADE